ncbi:MAG: alpha/beta fold hydrolase [Pseudomonadales bacterium]
MADLDVIDLKSGLVPSPRKVAVLTPPGYDSKRPTALLVWLHGGGGSHEFLSRMAPVFEAAWQAGQAPAMVVVTPDAERSFYLDYKDGNQRWESFVLDELIPFVESHYAIDPQQRYIGGISMGGMGSLRMAFKHPDRFRAVIALEPGIEPALAWGDVGIEDKFWRAQDLLEARYGKPMDEYWAANNPANIADANPARLRDSGLDIYLEVGSEDLFGLDRGTEFLHRLLYDHGIHHEYRYVLGADHVGRSVGPRVRDALAFLERRSEPPQPDPELERTRRMIEGLKRRAGMPSKGD